MRARTDARVHSNARIHEMAGECVHIQKVSQTRGDSSPSSTPRVTKWRRPAPQDCLNAGSNGSADRNARVIRVLKILRILRIARILKLVKFVT